MLVEVPLPLPTTLHLAGDALNEHIPFESEQLQGNVLTPCVNESSGDLVAPPVAALPRGWTPVDCDWGHVSHSSRDGTIRQAVVKVLLFRGNFLGNEGDAELVTSAALHLKQAFDLWLDWIQVLSGQDLCADERSVYRWNSNGVLPLYGVEADEPVEIRGQAFSCFVQTNHSANRAQLRYAASQASASESIPLAYTLLLEAQRALVRGRLRRAAAELGSALELCLSEAVRRKLAELSPNHGRRFVKDHTLGKIVTAAEDLNIIQATDMLHAKVVSMRNKAVHEATAPEFERACDAFELVRNILLRVEPVPEASSIRVER